jgi:hypothetical protein
MTVSCCVPHQGRILNDSRIYIHDPHYHPPRPPSRSLLAYRHKTVVLIIRFGELTAWSRTLHEQVAEEIELNECAARSTSAHSSNGHQLGSPLGFKTSTTQSTFKICTATTIDSPESFALSFNAPCTNLYLKSRSGNPVH